MSNSTDILTQLPQAPGAGGGDAFLVAYYVMVSMIVVVGIAYLLSRIMKNRQLEDWSKNEFVQVMVSAAIIGGLVLLMAPGSGIITKTFESLKPDIDLSTISPLSITGGNLVLLDCGMAGLPDGTVICYAAQYLSVLQTQILNLMASIFIFNMLLDVLSKLSVNIVIVDVTPLAGFSSIVQVFNSVLQSLFFLGILVQIEIALLQFINSTALSIFLPVGAVLRTFFGTRKLGGALIALAVGMYIVFPLTIALDVTALGSMNNDAFAEFQHFYQSTQSLSPIGGSTTGLSLTNPDSWVTYLNTYAANSVGLANAVTSIPKIITTTIASLVVQIVFLPALSIMLTVLAIKELAGLFGSEINLRRFEV